MKSPARRRSYHSASLDGTSFTRGERACRAIRCKISLTVVQQFGRTVTSTIRPFHFAARSTLIDSTSILNGPAFLSLNMKPKALTSSGFTAPASFTGLPNEVASNLSSGTLTSIHSSFLV